MDRLHAFVPGPPCRIAGSATGPLAGLGFAVKDLIDIAGVPTGGGNPDWPAYAGTARHAGVVAALLAAGASVVGKTITDEVSLGILGENPHDGTPLNSAAPDRVPGGSSSGSAAAVAGGACDFALGTDTGGSVRVPASFSGLYGIRPTHRRVDFSGICVQSPASDTCGWFARDAGIFARVGEVLLREAVGTAARPGTLLVATDAFGFADDAVQAALAPMVDRLAALAGTRRDEILAPSGLAAWLRAQRVLQQSEAFATFQPWLDRHNPRLAWSVARGLVAGAEISAADRALAAITRREVTARMAMLLPPGTILCMPTTPFPAPLRGLSVSALAEPRDRISALTCAAGHSGVPQVNIPGAMVDGAPVGLSILAGRGQDAMLLAVARALAG